MKRITLKVLEGDPVVDYARLIDEVVTQPMDRSRGASIEEMRQSIRVLDALERANGAIELEDADWEHLSLKVKAQAWSRVDRRLVQFVDDVTNA